MWMACYTQEEIGEKERLTQKAIGLILEEMASLPKLLKSSQAVAEHAVDFQIPLYNVWKQKEKQEEIAEKEGLTHQAVDLILQEMADLPKLAKSDYRVRN